MWLLKATVLLLLVSVAGMRIVAKVDSGLPRSNPAHFTSAATKMDQPKSVVTPDRVPLPLVMHLLVQPSASFEFRSADPDLPRPNQVAFTSSTQHRSPPVTA
ncbi:MAG TPA: hypothetical protein VEJ38_15760 [Candidatus Acidoferrales bacterium]|nr:hypothetical protein [Candidatus Acidoferrales bacterium]